LKKEKNFCIVWHAFTYIIGIISRCICSTRRWFVDVWKCHMGRPCSWKKKKKTRV